ncbi:adenosine deaminase [Massilia sp. BJB1822]|uniref:adenosine deaminase family protein n=1 Tax=Massilia sp. BJB1822 TaxID=2744470 RepID=UPI001594C628|nr:adenosine deaminase [Massilia sp. BJB1822]NVD99178.1 adenosine deaminase [Massilia sp. BJB1822]
MQKTVPNLMAALALASAFAAPAVHAASNEDITKRHFAALVAGSQPKLAELTLFFTMMPKGGDLHHHYSGAIYAEQYLEWVDKQGFCVNKTSYQIETKKEVIEAERAKPAAQRTCVNSSELIADNATYRELLQRWSTKDFYNHGAVQPPPDRAFFDTFGYFGPVASTNTNEGLKTLKQRAIAENLSYIETIFELAPMTMNAQFDQAVQGADQAKLQAQMEAWLPQLEKDAGFKQAIQAYIANVQSSSAGVDDEHFTMRYQPYVLRFLSPSLVFSQMVGAFEAATLEKKIVGVNIVGAENFNVSMRDYSMHMQMFKFLKTKYPKVKVALHAGELAMGMVPPEGLKFHIAEAVHVAGANRIGHGMDIAHENNALSVMKAMRERGIPVEVNLTSNEFILGIKGEAHPINLYRKQGVPFVISTDDAGVTRHTLSSEYVLFASRYQTDYAEVKKLSYDSLRYAFLDEGEKQRLLKQLDARFAKFEADIAASQRKAGK